MYINKRYVFLAFFCLLDIFEQNQYTLNSLLHIEKKKKTEKKFKGINCNAFHLKNINYKPGDYLAFMWRSIISNEFLIFVCAQFFPVLLI